MFLHSGAAMHRHEYSAPLDPLNNSVSRRSVLTRSVLKTPLPRRASTYEPSPILQRPTGPPRPLSDCIIPPHTSEPVVRFQEPETDTMSEDARSLANSEGSVTTAGGGRRRRRRSSRTSTAFHLAHPAPTLTQKQRLLQIRPRLLLQLQLLSNESRPKPAIDVLPSTVVVPRLAKKFPRMFRGKAELGVNDVMVVKSEEYDTPEDHAVEDTDSDEEALGNRDLMAVICQMRKDSGRSHGKAEIVLRDGSVWVASPLPNDLFEFVSVDERGFKTTARWVRRSPRRSDPDSASSNEFKFTFSIINPNSRRHPIMASLTNNKLDIPDFYTSVSSSAGKFPPTSPIRGIPGEPESQPVDDEPIPERTTHTIDENMKTLIQVTGIWVALRQGLSPYFRYTDAMAAATASASPRYPSAGRVRSVSLTPDNGGGSPAGTISSTPESTQSALGAVSGKFRGRSTKGSPASTAPPQFEQPSQPKRSLSTGAAFMQRVAARRAGNTPSTVPSDTEGDGTFPPPKHGIAEGRTGSLSNHTSGQQSLSLSRSSATTPDTPTRPRRRVQSAYIEPSALQNGFTNGIADRHSLDIMDGKLAPDFSRMPKTSKWKTFTNLFRRSHNNTRSD